MQLLSLLVAATMVPFALAQPANAEIITQWRLEQKHYLSGDHVIFLTPRAIKIINKTIGYQCLSKAPDWGVYVFRDDDKVIRGMTRAEFYKNQEYQPSEDGLANSRMTKIGSQSIGRNRVEVFRVGADEKWIGHLPGVSKPVNDLIVAYYKLSAVDGFLMKYTTDGEDAQEKNASFLSTEYSGRLTVMETLRIKEVPYNPAEFKLPVGYKKIVDIERLMTSSNRRKEADVIFEELGLGEKLGKNKTKQTK